ARCDEAPARSRDIPKTRGIEPLGGDDQITEGLLLRALISSVPDYLFVKDRAGRFVAANRSVADDRGFSVSDLIGKADFQVHDPALARRFFRDAQAVIRSGVPQIDLEERIVTAAGQEKWLATSKLPLRNAKCE